jgi:hypothetical protein
MAHNHGGFSFRFGENGISRVEQGLSVGRLIVK